MTAQATTILAMTGEIAQQKVETIIRESSKTFYFATQLLDPPQRRAIRALYGFCRASDDLVDRHGASAADLEAWRQQTNLPLTEQSDAVLYAWAGTRAQFGVDRRYEQELLDGVLADINFKPYATWQELERYCYLVASTVGLLSIPIIGLAKGASFEQAAAYAVTLGVALQLTNILRDVGEDARNGRVYLPLEDLARFGLSMQDILDHRMNENFKALMRFQMDRAHSLYEKALPGIALLSRGARSAVGAAALLYREILNEIVALDYDVFQRRAHTSGLKKVAMLPGILTRMVLLRPPGKAAV